MSWFGTPVNSGTDFPFTLFDQNSNEASGSVAGLASPVNATASQYTMPPYSWRVIEPSRWPSFKPSSEVLMLSFAHDPGWGSGPLRSPSEPPVYGAAAALSFPHHTFLRPANWTVIAPGVCSGSSQTHASKAPLPGTTTGRNLNWIASWWKNELA